MIGYALRRTLLAIPVMGVVAVIVFSLLYFAPGDPALVIAGDTASAEDIARIRHSLHLDQDPAVRFASWVWQLLHGDFGTSIYSGEPVLHLIGQRAGATVGLMLLATLFAVTIGITLGILAARRKGGAWDRLLAGYGTLGFSLPPFVMAYILAFVFASTLHWLPVQGFQPISAGPGPFLRTAILPALSLGIVFSALIANVTRAAMIEAMGQDYVRTAIAKGVGERTILFRHALKNAAIPIVTVIGSGVPVLIGGTVVVEGIFVVPGIGGLMVDAILHRDYPVIQAVVLLSSLVYVLTNLIIDLSYTLLDPRIRY
ncbi:ABC transporter permease [Flavisphingomonas formosensis]|uniref:ABC transporter permease n=1 Tax=Flavisphingomonas formosensis TaxID=861534 RepID=UPI0012FA19F1|nr:ABC transporter permease [Sphingomonas formosensis]